jgi:hypothetical protein
MSAVFQQSAALATTISSQAGLPASKVLPWAICGGLLMVVAVYFVGVEEGALSLVSGSQVHEYVHDARHLLGFPCH